LFARHIILPRLISPPPGVRGSRPGSAGH
jgi:hypothetical protein